MQCGCVSSFRDERLLLLKPAASIPMKHERHNAIRELVAAAPISNQDELRRKLVHQGFDVNQATLSRDMRELKLYKGPTGYALPNGNAAEEDDERPSVAEVLYSFGLRVKQARSLLVLITIHAERSRWPWPSIMKSGTRWWARSRATTPCSSSAPKMGRRRRCARGWKR